MSRVDYVDDPNAPMANNVVPSVVVVVTDANKRILLVHKKDNDLWALPGGGHEIGESIVDTAVRETKEETGIDVEILRLTGTYTNPGHVMAYDDGEVRQQFSLCFVGRQVGGVLNDDSTETKEVRWVPTADVEHLPFHPSMRMRLEHALDPDRQNVFLG